MKQRLFISTTLIISAGLLIFLAVSLFIMSRSITNLAQTTVVEATQIAAGLFSENINLHDFVNAGDNSRITVISSDGTVLADTWEAEIIPYGGHLSRPEIAAAALGESLAYVRHSATHGINFVYYALRVEISEGYVFVRAALPVEQIDVYLRQSLSWFFGTLVFLAIICFFVIRDIANRILAPFTSIENNLRRLSLGRYEMRPTAHSFPEIDNITRGIDTVSVLLQENYSRLQSEKNKLSHILNSIGNGLFVVDEKLSLALVNIAAYNIFAAPADIEGKKLTALVPDETLVATITDCVKSVRNTIFEFVLHGKTYLVTLKWLPDTDLTMVALADITESRESSRRREEFFANASHELKTPLTAIKGFNELAAAENKDENLTRYINGISRETNRLMSLIGGMLKLSALENASEKNPVPVSLLAIVNEVKETFLPVVAEKSITFEFAGSAKVLAEPNHIYEIVKNLIENAIRYTSPGGKVTVLIAEKNDAVTFTVSDNGIGISSAEQSKIFERFYRVEKSRSAEGGGTGLGLAIVKHICALYSWKLSLKSKPGVGTTVTVEF